MLTLRLIRGAGALALTLRSLVALAACGVGLLLLAALDLALERPSPPGAALPRLLCCLPPLLAAVWLTVGVARSDATPLRRAALDAVGWGRRGLAVLAGGSTVLATLLGSAVALAVFASLRAPGDGVGQLATGSASLPLPATLTLLLALPVTAGCASALTLARGRTRAPNSRSATARSPRTGLLVATALLATGVALGLATGTAPAPRPAELGVGVWLGWSLSGLGLVLAGPGLTALAGGLLTLHDPGPLRLLAGRMLRAESVRLGGPLGVLAALLCTTLTAGVLYGVAPLGPFGALGGAVVLGCVVASVLLAATQQRAGRATAGAALGQIGAPATLLRRVAVVRGAALLAAFAPAVALVAWLAALPFSV